MDIEISLNTTQHYIREGLWRTCQIQCTNEYKRVNDPAFIFWKGYALYREGNPNEAINELMNIHSKREVSYAVNVALIFYHEQCNLVDRDAIADLKARDYDLSRMATDKAFIMLAYFFMYNEELRKAYDMLNNTGGSSDVQCAKAWYDLYNTSESSAPNALSSFEGVLENDSRHLDALIGKARAAERLRKFQIALDTLNEIIVEHPKYLPAIAEKSRLLLTIYDWEQSYEMAQKALTYDKHNIKALMIQIFHLLAREGRIEESIERLKTLSFAIDKTEPKNSDILFECAKLFSRICGRNPEILQITFGFLERARKIKPLDADLAVELAEENLMINNTKEAYNLFQEAASLDETKMEALTGMIQCRIRQGNIDDAEQQLEFVSEIQVSVGRTSEIAYLEAMLSSRKPYGSVEAKITETTRFIDEALKLHITATKSLVPDLRFYVRLNPDFLMNLAREYLQFTTFNPGKHIDQVPPNVIKGNKLLETITKQIPGLTSAFLLLAKGKSAAGDVNSAMKHLNRIIEIDPKHEEALILSALISYQNNNLHGAYSNLEQAIANNLSIRENPLFMLIKGEIELKSGDNESALNTLEAAFKLPGVLPTPGQRKKVKRSVFQILQFEERERCQVFVNLAKAYVAAKRINDAKTIMSEAISNFTGTSEEGNVLMANAEIAVASDDIKKALSILKAVGPDSPYFIESRKLMAQICLENLKDRRQYAKCYLDLIEVSSTYDNYKLLGDAFMRIQEPEDAIRAYEQALSINPKDEDITREIGKGLVQTHDYQRAWKYYEEALRADPKRLELRLDMGKLCILVGNYKVGEELLAYEIYGDEFNSPDIQSLQRNVDGLLQLARLLFKKNKSAEGKPIPEAKQAFLKAIDMQNSIIEKCKQEGQNLAPERAALGDIYFELGKYFKQHEKGDDKTRECFEASLKHHPDNEQVLAELAELYMKLGDKQTAEQKCVHVLRVNPTNEYAIYLISELMMLKNQPEAAIEQFRKILNDKPENFNILAKLIEFMRKAGFFNDVKPYLDQIQKRIPNANEPGLCYCRGLFHKYSRNPQEALVEFVKAKRGNQFFERAITQMIDIYLNPDQELLYTHMGENKHKNIDVENVKAADNLAKELKLRSTNSLRILLSESYVWMYSKRADQAADKLKDVLKQDDQQPAVLLAMAVAKFISGKNSDAKACLKQFRKLEYSLEFSEELEMGWLMLADLQIDSDALDQAEEVLKRILQYNASCGKAEEYLGLIQEKQQRFDEAAESYKRAWILSMERSASIGYRLAYTYLKSKRFVEAINISKKILETFPDFQKIDKEILSKARESLKGDKER